MILPAISKLSRSKSFRILLTFILISVYFLSSLSVSKVRAGTFTGAKVTISDSRAERTNVEYEFTATPSANGHQIKTIDIYFCDAPTGTCNAPDATFDTVGPTLKAGDTISGGGNRTMSHILGAANTARIAIETPADQNAEFVFTLTGVTNAQADKSIYARMTTFDELDAEVDTAQMGIAILATDSIAVSADVGSTFSFTVAAATTGNVNTEPITLTTGTSDSAIPYGVIVRDDPQVAAHDLTVTSNANLGYQVTIKSTTTPALKDGSNEIDDWTGANGNPTAWSAPLGDKNDGSGYFGYTTDDATLDTTAGATDRFTDSAPEWAGLSTTAAEVAYSDVAVTSEVTRVGWKIGINGNQPPGEYRGQIIMVATPTY